MWTFLAGLAGLNQFEGGPSPSKSSPPSTTLLQNLAWAVNDEFELTKLKDGSTRLSRAVLAEEMNVRRGPGFETFMSLGYWLWNTEQDEIQAYPMRHGAMLFVGPHYQVRFAEDFCEGKIVEVRDTEGFYAQPRSPRPGQIGFDCKSDRSVSEIPPDPALVMKALQLRSQEVPNAQLSHVVFPNSGTPRVRERQQSKGECRDVYLHVYPNSNTCDGVTYSYHQVGATCCTASDCGYSADHALNRFLDALSLRDMSTVKGFVAPNGKLTVSGNIVDDPIELHRWTTGAQLKHFSQRAPGWSGSDNAGCREENDSAALCHFGGGGTHFTATMSRASDGRAWYVNEVVGETH